MKHPDSYEIQAALEVVELDNRRDRGILPAIYRLGAIDANLKILKEFKGKTTLGITLTDKEKNYRIEMVSKKYSVAVCEDFINGIEHLGLSCSVVRKN